MSRLLIQNGRVIDPANNLDQVTNIYISDGKIFAVGDACEGFQADQTIEATGHYVIPGIVDICARLREPGLEYKADIASETVAATSAGITTLCIPPDTDPVIDEPAVVELIHRKVKNAGHANVVALGALTLGLKGEYLSEMAALKTAGCVGLSNARSPVHNTLVISRAFEYAATHNMTVFIEANDPWLSNKGCAHEGPVSTRLGLPPIPYSAETASIAHYLELITDTNVRAHFCRLSCARSVEMINQAKTMGLNVTADVSAHQLHLTEMDISSFNSQCHVIPPLRNQRDRDALRTGISHNILSAICSDHQPHEIDAKQAPFPATEPGISALETLLPLTLRLVNDGQMNLTTAISKLTKEPAEILGINRGTLSQNAAADICIINPATEWTLDANSLISQGRNTPFHGWNFTGKVSQTLIDGKVIYSAN
ncbi:MAG: dihydroorotase [Gammaproteobacteria bacterium]|nr:dihydroorotase [Gammaproteobacteria bacterium]MDH5735924.1 dihydroorotase [Gammaproteobacteria bacterium]